MTNKRILLDRFSNEFIGVNFNELKKEKDIINVLYLALDYLISPEINNPQILLSLLAKAMSSKKTVQELGNLITRNIKGISFEDVKTIETEIVDKYIVSAKAGDLVYMELTAKQILSKLKFKQNINVFKLGRALSNKNVPKKKINGLATYKISRVISSDPIDVIVSDLGKIIPAVQPFKKAYLLDAAEVSDFYGKAVTSEMLDNILGIIKHKKRYYIKGIINVNGEKVKIWSHLKTKKK